MRTTKAFRWMALIVGLVALLVVIGVVISVGGRRPPRPISNLPPAYGPFTMNGLLPGMTREECIAILGPPTKEFVYDGKVTVLQWKEHQLLAWFDGTKNPYHDRIWAIDGSELRDADGNVVLRRKSPIEDFLAVLPNAQYLQDMGPVGRGQVWVFGMSHYVVRGDRVLFRFAPDNMRTAMRVEAWLPAEEVLDARLASAS